MDGSICMALTINGTSTTSITYRCIRTFAEILNQTSEVLPERRTLISDDWLDRGIFYSQILSKVSHLHTPTIRQFRKPCTLRRRLRNLDFQFLHTVFLECSILFHAPNRSYLLINLSQLLAFCRYCCPYLT